MASLHRPFLSSSTASTIPLFLAPAFARTSSCLPISHAAQFSTTVPHNRGSNVQREAKTKAARAGKKIDWSLQSRPKLDRNKKRGVSAIRRTGPRSMRGLWEHALPVPAARDHKDTEPEYLDAHDHGLWGFFDSKKEALLEPDQEASHGRAWEYKELSWKSYDDLHKLYWICVKEQNRCLTREKERSRLRAGYGTVESEHRVSTVRTTMKLIREVLVNRQLSFNEASGLLNTRAVAADIITDADNEMLEKRGITEEEEELLQDGDDLEPYEASGERQPLEEHSPQPR